MDNQIWIFRIHISKMTSKSQYEKNSDAFAPYYYDDEAYWLADAIDMTTTTAAEGLRNSFLNANKIQMASVCFEFFK
jgi:hypothetical protein